MQVKTELMTLGGAQCSGCQSQTKISSQPSAAWPHHLGKEAERVMKDSLVNWEIRLQLVFQLKVTLLVKYFF